MKKLLCLFSAALLVFASCSDNEDDNSSNTVSSVLVKKLTWFENDKPVSRDFLYDGNKIVKITDADGSVVKYTYTGNVITKLEEIDENGGLDSATEYIYASGKLTTLIRKETGDTYYYKTKYTHNAEGTVSYDQFRGVILTEVEEEYGATGKYGYKDGNLVKLEVSYYGSDRSYVYEYDDKNHPFKNVLGFDLLLDEVTVNNVIKETATSGSGDNIYTNIITYAYKYDANNYPTQRVMTFPNGSSTSSETTQYAY